MVVKKKISNLITIFSTNHTNASLDLLGLSTPPSSNNNTQNQQNTLIDVLGDIYNGGSMGVNNAKK